MDESLRDHLDWMRQKVRVDFDHSSKWITLKEIGDSLQISDEEIMKRAREFELHITFSVTSINSRINIAAANSFVKYVMNE